MSRALMAAATILTASTAFGQIARRLETQEIDPHVGEVCYAVTVADVNGDKKPDVVALSEDALVWYENPSWTKRVILIGKTARDNVCVQAHDIDGDGKIDFAVGAGWNPSDTNKGGTLQWVGRDQAGEWQVHPIECDEPTIHRIRWADVKGAGKPQLIVAPLQGRGTKGPNWGDGSPVRVLVLDIPADPAQPEWPTEVADASLHTIHNLWPVDRNGDGKIEVLLASWEGVFEIARGADGTWTRTKLGAGNQGDLPNKGASEIKLGKLKDGRQYIATIEPWHGHEVAVYTEPTKSGALWDRHVIADGVSWGHAVWCADLDQDGGEELIIGQRDPRRDTIPPRGPGVWIYEMDLWQVGGRTQMVHMQMADNGGMACEDALAADLDGDGRPDIVAGGRATHNVRIYWNRQAPPAVEVKP